MALQLLASLALLSVPALAHGGLANYTVGDTWYRGYDPNLPPETQLNQTWMIQRQWVTIDPIFTVSEPYLACNNPGAPPPSYIPIRAGDNITAVYWYWLHAIGPMSVWLARCGDTPAADCRDVDVNRGLWYQKDFQRWDGSPSLWPVTIPKGLKSGTYIIRHEILSLHVPLKPQFHPECAHLNITGGGDLLPSEETLVRFPGVYEEDDPSIFIDVYSEENANRTDYTVPGGPIWEGFAN
ncbi:glycoside hydrolase family 61 protein [Thermothelomyces heterothallicus CBS 202.75]|uniref:glycoside hydrolase family 61 protein n=1 Tax=Thermothelomyces heterothallicus CBS 202.75 TaxID=1149848 RepID=UPI0037449D24